MHLWLPYAPGHVLQALKARQIAQPYNFPTADCDHTNKKGTHFLCGALPTSAQRPAPCVHADTHPHTPTRPDGTCQKPEMSGVSPLSACTDACAPTMGSRVRAAYCVSSTHRMPARMARRTVGPNNGPHWPRPKTTDKPLLFLCANPCTDASSR